MCEFYSRIGRQKFTVLRHSNIYGPFDKFELEKSHVFGASITKVMTASDGKIIIWGDGTESRDLLYVKDLIECVDKAISYQSEKFAIFNCGYGSAITVVNLIKKILNIANKKLEIQFDLGKPTIKTSLFLDCNKVKEAIGWKRNTLLDDGIKMTIDWWSENIGNKYGTANNRNRIVKATGTPYNAPVQTFKQGEYLGNLPTNMGEGSGMAGSAGSAIAAASAIAAGANVVSTPNSANAPNSLSANMDLSGGKRTKSKSKKSKKSKSKSKKSKKSKKNSKKSKKNSKKTRCN
jgi:hypothetical protein